MLTDKLKIIIPVFILIGCDDTGKSHDLNSGGNVDKGKNTPSLLSDQEKELHEETNKRLDEILNELKLISSKMDNLNLNISKPNPGASVPPSGVDNDQNIFEAEKQKIIKGLKNQIELNKHLANGEGVSQGSRTALLNEIESLNLQIQEINNIKSQSELKAWKIKNNR